MKNEYVTLLIPAYNGGKLIHRLLESVLSQTYPYIELIIINDGSTDNTVEVIEGYRSRLNERGYGLKLITQENVGQSATINNGLKLVDGEFLAWPDIDDWYASPHSIEKLVAALSNSGDDIGAARCSYQRIDENTMNCYTISQTSHTEQPANLFKDAVYFKAGFWLEPGGWMIKTKFLDELIPNREIYTSKNTGQNTQILWPYLYHKKCVSLAEPLYCYLVRKDSHSRGMYTTFEAKELQQKEYQKTFNAVIDSISGIKEEELIEYRKYFAEKYVFHIMRIAKTYNRTKTFKKNYKICQNNKHLKTNKEDTLFYILCFLPLGRYLYKLIMKVYNILKVYLKEILSFLRRHLKSLCLLFSLSLLINIMVAVAVFSPKIVRKNSNWSFEPISYTSTQEFEPKILAGTEKLLEDEYATDETVMYYKTIDEFYHRILNKKAVRVYEYGEYGYLLYFTYMYGKNTHNTPLIAKVKEKFDKGFLNTSTITINKNDQISYGCIALSLYQDTKDKRYKLFCDKLFQRLDSLDKTDGVILYHEGDLRQHTDGIGLVGPFLRMYANHFHSERALEMWKKMLDGYIVYGLDYKTGLPAQSYHSRTKIKDLRTNWGRGTSWFLLGKMNGDSALVSCGNILYRTDSTLQSLPIPYTQYLGQTEFSQPDMSATVPILYYLISIGKKKMSKAEFCKLIAPYTDNNGIIRFNSPTIGRPNEYPNAFQSHHLTQGIALYLLSILK